LEGRLKLIFLHDDVCEENRGRRRSLLYKDFKDKIKEEK
jgi:hypothetical protein